MIVLDRLPDPDLDAQFYDGVPLKRLVAWLIDVAIVIVGSLVFTLVFGLLTLGFGFVLYPAILFTISFCYRWLTISARSATLGMMFTGIELRGPDGERLSPPLAAAHSGIFVVLMATVIGWACTMVAIAATRYHQGIPDLLLGTTAINRPVG